MNAIFLQGQLHEKWQQKRKKMYIYRYTCTGQMRFEDTLCMDKIEKKQK